MDTVAFTTRQLTNLPLLIGSLEVELGDITPGSHLALAEHEVLGAAGHFLKNGLVIVECVPVLVDVGRHHRVPDAESAAVGLLLADDHPEEGSFAGSVGTDDTNEAAARQVEVKIFH